MFNKVALELNVETKNSITYSVPLKNWSKVYQKNGALCTFLNNLYSNILCVNSFSITIKIKKLYGGKYLTESIGVCYFTFTTKWYRKNIRKRTDLDKLIYFLNKCLERCEIETSVGKKFSFL